MCDCHSYNMDSGVVSEVVLRNVPVGIGKKSVCVDACIANVVRHLWDSDVLTQSSCCGHNLEGPSLVLEDGLSQTDVDEIRGIIAQVDTRTWRLLSWRHELVEM